MADLLNEIRSAQIRAGELVVLNHLEGLGLSTGVAQPDITYKPGEWFDATQAAKDVLAERQRQIDSEGWTSDHDDGYSKAEMADAAACYATNAGVFTLTGVDFIPPTLAVAARVVETDHTAARPSQSRRSDPGRNRAPGPGSRGADRPCRCRQLCRCWGRRMNIVPAHPNDVFVWPCGTWCFREDAHEMTHMSDDYRVLPAESTEAEDFLVQEYAT